MKILMISTDRGLLGKGQLGNVIERHKRYGEHVDRMDIIVFSRRGFSENRISETVRAFPTNARFPFAIPLRALDIGKKLFIKHKYHLIVAQDPLIAGWVGMKLKRIFGVKFLVHLHGDFIDNRLWVRESFKNRFLRHLMPSVLSGSDAIRVMSRGQKEKLRRFVKKPVRVIATPVDVNYFENFRGGIRKDKKWNKAVLMVGRLDPVKDFGTLFAAMDIVFKKYEDCGLYLAGNYTRHEDVPLPSDKVVLCGQVAYTDLAELYYSSDVVVLSSKSESFGKVLVEAGASLRPVVATETTGAKEIVRDKENGYLVPIGDAHTLAEKILKVLSDSELAKRMGKRGRELAKERFSEEKSSEQIIRYWKDIIEDRIYE